MTTRKIIYVSGTRADYGLMRETLKVLDQSADVELSLCVTGMHLDNLYGNTIEEIEVDKFNICGCIPVDVKQATPGSMAKSIGYEIIAMTELFEREKPDIILLLGDRGEMLAGAIAAIHLNIHVVHLHGGERSGTVDEMVRHSISKMAHYHFVATQAARDRLIKMGEKQNSVFVVGAPGLDQIKRHRPKDRSTFYSIYQLNETQKTALLIYHPVVQEYNEIEFQIEDLFRAALDLDIQLICFEPNSDAGGQLIRGALEKHKENPNIRIVTHSNRADYLDCLANVDIMIGNSSSGIIEAASFNLNVVNVGIRQNLREACDNVINVSNSYKAIQEGIQQALGSDKKIFNNIYGDGNTGEKCLHLLKTISLDSQILNKFNAY